MSGPMMKKRRAAIACTSCHARKVRCNVVLVGQPCSNCQQDQTLCALHVSARGKHKRRKVNTSQDSTNLQPAASEEPTSLPTNGVQCSLSDYNAIHRSQADNELQRLQPDYNESQRLLSDLSLQDDYESQANVNTYRKIVDDTDTNEAKVPMYVGELQSLRFIFHVAREDKGISCKAHYLIPEPRRRQLSPEELACLKAKGAFSTETEELRTELLSLFFDYVYPILPIVEPHEFFRRYDAGGAENISPLLLQSMFLAASNALYDFEYETDKLCLIQSVLLLGYWLGNSHDKMDSWHWIGVAISLSQSLGLHRDAGCSRIPPAQRALWRRIWWCCFYRDRIITLGMGRAFRINVDDCDVKELTLADLVHNGSSANLKDSSATILRRCNSYAPIFLEIIKMSHLLGDVLATVYRPRKIEDFPDPASWSRAELIEEKLTAWQLGLDPRCRVDAPAFSVDEPSAMILHKYYMQIFHHVTMISLYKPFVFQGDLLPTNPASDVRSKIAWEGCQLAAFAATDSFRRLTELDLIRFLPPESITMLIAIIAILFLSKCLSSGMKWHLASQNLDLIMLVVQQLQEKYLAARFIFAYYNAAFDKVAPSQKPSLEPAAMPDMLAATGAVESAPASYEQTTVTELSGTPYGGLGTFSSSGQEDGLNTWAECFQSGMTADFDILFGADGIFRGLEEFDIEDMVA
ncbi:hypothetical protein H2200_002338 [Cladophialophora chaetospira]|uniref:Zn(2)-C6 fungal-type domain-containing protein n=1 Tax=Cladophialophora chaetospira TaxID=386627 RepID=A0AA38XIQ9_9EURO|nr:hypothetical protein H2200_002338 [Cladophialophora chaetospira]